MIIDHRVRGFKIISSDLAGLLRSSRHFSVMRLCADPSGMRNPDVGVSLPERCRSRGSSTRSVKLRHDKFGQSSERGVLPALATQVGRARPARRQVGACAATLMPVVEAIFGLPCLCCRACHAHIDRDNQAQRHRSANLARRCTYSPACTITPQRRSTNSCHGIGARHPGSLQCQTLCGSASGR